MPSCAGLFPMHYKIAVAKSLVDDLLPRVDGVEGARRHVQRALNAIVAPGARATQEHAYTADSAGYCEITGEVGNPVHGMGEEESVGMGILPHLRIHWPADHSTKEAIRIIELAQKCAADGLNMEDVGAIKRCGRVLASLLMAAQEALSSCE